jgi:hypothetical protein
MILNRRGEGGGRKVDLRVMIAQLEKLEKKLEAIFFGSG